MNTVTLNGAALDRFLRNNDLNSIKVALRHEHPADIVGMIGDMTPEDMSRVLLCLDEAKQATLFGYFSHDTQKQLAQALDRRDMARIFGAMAHDERADLFAELEDDQKNALLPALAQAEREDMRKLAAYPEGTAGSVMTSDYATVPPHLTTVQAVEHLRRVAPDAETIYHSYVLDEERRLIGTVSLRDLIVARDDARVEEIMRREPPFIRAEDKREEAVEKIRKYDLLALPVINGGDRLAGIVTYDDAMDVAREAEDVSFVKTSAVAGLGTSMLSASIGLLYRKRVPWLVILVFGNIFSGAGIAYFEDTIAAYIALVFFLPLLVDSGGNAGSQSATMMVRALATGDVRMKDWGKMVTREAAVAGLLGLTMALAVSAIGIFRGGPEIALVVSLTMVLIVLVGSLIGMSLPFILSKFKLDPAAASAPLVTSLADAIGVIIYFAMATWLLDVSAAAAG
ncbi:magnesium transporter [Rhodobacteraceae bacterium 2376]|uniref:Magnesium transporter MgtE n=1 Tax=Rhabdonatronobacter sediminivivens TaxID=2743469 RepID=A0A7Z0HWH2_9RHOB|nr:magnesium transporter [Rhabdonatronobacter sediminivivens]NYS23623.1 magnesium transporter [Rhabdonatronobacter sediminivivens]